MSESEIESVKPEIEPPVLASERMELKSKVSQWLLSTAILEVKNSVLRSQTFSRAQTFSKGDRVRVDLDCRFGGSLGRVLNQGRYVAVQFDIPVCGAGSPFLARATLFSPHQLTLVSDETSPGVDFDPVSESIAEAAKTSPGVEVDWAQQPIAQAAENTPGVDPGVDVDLAQEAIAQVAETSPGVGIARRKEPLIETVKISPGVKTEATVLGPAAKNPILTGVTFSDRFLARYAPPQAEIIHFQSDADGQLSLLNFEIESVDEPPDPDDFESLDAFREALARWDWEHNEVSPEHNEPLQVSLDSFSLWGLCPADWYEPAALLEPSSMLELSPLRKSSITSGGVTTSPKPIFCKD